MGSVPSAFMSDYDAVRATTEALVAGATDATDAQLDAALDLLAGQQREFSKVRAAGLTPVMPEGFDEAAAYLDQAIDALLEERQRRRG